MELCYTEEQLIQGVKQNDSSAFSYLYNNYSRALLFVIRKIVRDEHTAEDILQETFVKIWSNIHQFDMEKGRFYTWILNIAKNKAIDFTRSKSHIMNGMMEKDSEKTLLDIHTTQHKTEHIGVLNLVMKLKPKYQSLVYMVFFNGNTMEEVAQTQNIPLGTIKTRMRSSISLLRKDFEYAC